MKLRKAALGLMAMTFAGSAFAADLAVRPAPVVVPPPLITWTGFYVGINAGYAWQASSGVNTVAAPGFCNTGPGCFTTPNYSVTSASAATFPLSAPRGGVFGGLQAGYNYQFSSLLLGLETDIQGIAQSNGNNGGTGIATIVPNPNFPGFPVTNLTTVNKNINYLGTVRARLGFVATPTWLIYATGGLAYGGVKLSNSTIQNLVSPGVTAYGGYASYSSTRIGYTVGGGAEWMFLPNWSVKGEFLYYDLGRGTTTTLPLVSPLAGGIFSTAYAVSSTRFNGYVARGGINYHFAWGSPAPVVAKY